MFKDSLYKINLLTHTDGNIQAVLELNEHHEILKGHFPGQPVLPGACMLQMIKEVLQTVLEKNLQLLKAANIKFMQVIDPQKNNIIKVNLNYKLIEVNSMQVTSSMLSDETVCFKFQGTFKAS